MADWIQCRPLSTKWPKPETPADARKGDSFKMDYARIRWYLEYELRWLDAREILLEFDMPRANFRKLDTWPFADSRQTTPRVMLRFVLADVGEVQYPCDRYLRWHANLRAISRTLESQRAIQRYEALTQAEIYGGLKRLPPAGGTSEERELTPEAAAELLIAADPSSGNGKLTAEDRAGIVTLILKIPSVAHTVARQAVKATHPDTGGNPEGYAEVARARAVLQKHHSGADV